MQKRIVPAAGALWEAVRYLLLAVLFTIYFNRELSGEYALFFLWITSYFFVLFGVLLLAALQPGRYGVLVRLAGAGKALQALTGLLLYLYEQNVIGFLSSLLATEAGGTGITYLSASLPMISGVLGIDLIFTLFLLLYKPTTGGNPGPGGDKLPRTHVTEVEDT